MTELTIEQLAQETGMTVRNIRNHQSRGLLPPPEVRARTGFYGAEHVARLRLIQEMQADGFNLKAIERLLAGAEGATERVIGLKRAVTEPFETESPEILTLAELQQRFGPADAKALAKAQRLGLLLPLGDGRFEAPSPALMRAAEEAIAGGVPLAAALATIEKVMRSCRAAAQAFVALFLEQVWKPFEDAGRPADRWDEVTATIDRLRPFASEAVLATFQHAMTGEVEKAFGRVLER